MAKIRKVVLVKKRNLYKSVNAPYDWRGYVVDCCGKEFNISQPETIPDSDLIIIEKDSESATWPEWTVIDEPNK
jgi:hypothetical protein